MAGFSTKSVISDIHDRVKELSRKEMVRLLRSVGGVKDLVIDKDLMKPLDRICTASFLKDNGIDKIFKLQQESGSTVGSDKKIYLVRPSMLSTKYIAEQINADKNNRLEREYVIAFVPRKLHVCEMILEQEGVHGYVSLYDCPIHLFPLCPDLYSIELPEFFRQTFLEHDQTCLHNVAKALLHLNKCGLRISSVYGVGNAAKDVHHLMNTLWTYEPVFGNDQDIVPARVFIIDRDVDYVTPLCTQVTFEGLLDETFQINCGFVEFGPEVTGAQKPIKHLLSSEDQVLEEIRNRHFSNVLGFLSSTVKEVQTGYDKRHQLTSVSDMKRFVSDDLKSLKSQHRALTLYIGASEMILKEKSESQDQLSMEANLVSGEAERTDLQFIEDFIIRQGDMRIALRLLCLLSVSQDGLSPQQYKTLKTLFLHAYGFEHLTTWHNVKKVGLLVEQTAGTQPAAIKQMIRKQSTFKTLARKLVAVPKSSQEVNLKTPSDMSYVFSGNYAPLSCKLMEQCISRESFLGLEDITKHLTHPFFSESKPTSARAKTGLKVVVMCFIGGCTYAEMAALRLLAKVRGWQILVVTTNMVNGSSLMAELMEKICHKTVPPL